MRPVKLIVWVLIFIAGLVLLGKAVTEFFPYSSIFHLVVTISWSLFCSACVMREKTKPDKEDRLLPPPPFKPARAEDDARYQCCCRCCKESRP